MKFQSNVPGSEAPSPPSTSIHLVQTFAAPVTAVFAAWTDPALLRRWLAPWPSKVVEASADLRVGGHHRLVVRRLLGGQTITSGEYVEILPDQRLVQTWVRERNGKSDRHPTLLSLDFRSTAPHSTEITLRQDQLMTTMDREASRTAWKRSWKNLNTLLARTISLSP